MKIIALLGEGSSGKSMTLKYLIEEVEKRLYGQNPTGNIFCSSPSQKCKTYVDDKNFQSFINQLRDEEKQQPKAIQDRFTKVFWNGKTVGIFTIGDDEKYLKDKFHLFADCDIIVCPTHEKCEMLRFLFSQATEEIWFVRKDKMLKNTAWDQMVKNSQAKAAELFKRLDFIVHL